MSGASYVVFGYGNAFAAELNLSTLNGTNGFQINGEAAFDLSGVSVASAGDVNGDGFDDLIIGARWADPNGSDSGAAYVVFGSGSAFDATLDLSSLDGTNGFQINGAAAYDGSGISVAAAGDVNGDGYDDLIVGAYGADPNGSRSGASYIIFGKATPTTGDDELICTAGADNVSGVAGHDTIFGLAGNDQLFGGAGNDSVDGGDGNDSLEGGAGNDSVDGGEGNDSLDGGADNDSLVGAAGRDTLIGGAGNDRLDGGLGNDAMSGGAGTDTYVTGMGDTITENADEGTDLVLSSVTTTLGSNLENLTLTGRAPNGTGNALNNVMTGNSSANTLSGLAGNDSLIGGAGNDTLIGGAGNDIYVMDSSDTITEASGSGSGTDTVQSSGAYTLGDNLENLTLTGSSAINGTGNTLNNTLTGNSAANTLNGGAGTDILVGGAGDDIYVTDGGDTITEASGIGSGTDAVQSSATYTLGDNLETLNLTGASAINGTGNALNNTLTGNSAANTLNGGAGADILNGGTGKDLLTGAAGNDTFIFNTVVESAITATTTDLITDFVIAQDKISLSGIDAFASSGPNDAFIWKGTDAFGSTTKGEVRYQKFDKPGTANDHTMVWIDNDSDTDVEMAIRLTGLYNLAATDFML